MLMVIIMKDNGIMIKQKVMDLILIMMGLSIWDIGKKICNMDLVIEYELSACVYILFKKEYKIFCNL